MSSDQEYISPYAFPGIRRSDLSPEKYPYLFKKVKKLEEDEIIDIIANHNGITREQLFSKFRHSNLVYSRQVYQKVLRLYGKKMVEIAKKIGCDHTTVIHNIRRFDELYEVDDMFRYNTNELLQKLHIDTKDISK